MKAMILAAGKGERMWPLTKDKPKPLLQAHGKTLIEHHIVNLAQAGIKDIIINLWYLGLQIENYLGDGSRYGVTLHYARETQLLDTGGGIQNVLHFFGEEKFIVVSADIYTDFDFSTLILPDDKAAHIILVSNPEYHPFGDFALQNGIVSLIGEYKLTYANIGIYRPEFFDQAIHPYPLSLLFKKHISRQLVTGAIYDGVWFNVGTPMELQKVNCFHIL